LTPKPAVKDRLLNIIFLLLLTVGFVFRALCLIVFLIGTISFSLGWQKQQSDTEPSRSYVGVFFEAHKTPDGKMTISNWRTNYVKANGEFKIVFHGLDAGAAFAGDATAFSGTSSPVYAGTSEGTFIKGTGSDDRKSMSPTTPTALENMEKLYHSHSFLKNSSNLVRMDKVAGFDVYVLKTVNQEYPSYWTECSFSPLTGRSPLRIVMHQPDESLYIIEAVKIEFRDVPDNLNDDIKSLPNTGKLGDKTASPKNSNSN